MQKTESVESFFIEMEKKWLDHWYKKGTVANYLTKNDKSDKRFSFQDGPITANNPMGVHHAWGRTYKDTWQKFHNLLGYKQRFQNGFDCQGLWVEVEVEKEIGVKNKQDIEKLVPGDRKASIAKFVQLCKDRVMKFSAIQTDQTKRLGNFMDWDNSYFTMSDENNYMIWHFLKKVYENGWLYKGKDSVPWCPRCETAISQHEMLTEDYKELTHETVFFKLPIITKGWDNTKLLVWTTTPWTIPANVAVGVNVKYTYNIWQNEQTGEKIIFIGQDDTGAVPTRQLKNRVLPVDEYIFHNTEGTYKKVKDIKGSGLIGLKYEAAFDNLPIVIQAEKENPSTFHTVVDGSEIVTAIEGTGLLHVAPGAGQEDFQLGKKEKLSMIGPIGDDASYIDGMGQFSGKNAKKHPELIIDHLKELDGGSFLLKTLQYTHRYPACWRCKTELVWKVADEWYIAMDKGTKDDSRTLRQRMVENAKKIEWMPEFGLDRELDWLKNMHDWLISKKNRYWGLALPIYDCEKCGIFEVIGSKDELKERSVTGWKDFEGHTPHKPYIDEVTIKCSSCGETVQRVNDVGNPWLDAGIVPYSTVKDHNQGDPLYWADKEEWRKWFPIDFITESFPGQFKNWFYAMIAMSTVLEDENPFKRVLGFATMQGEDGRAMHKSWGNYIEFNEGADTMGVDVMRWIFARQNPAENMLFGYKKADEVRRQFYLILWNVYKFYQDYAELDGHKSSKMKFPEVENVLDVWILHRFVELTKSVHDNMKEYNPRDAAATTELFVSDLSTWYLRRSRNRVWVHAESEDDKSSFYKTVNYVLANLSIILSPFMPFLTEEMYTKLTGAQSVHLSSWPELEEMKIDTELIIDMALVRSIVEVAHKARKEVKMKVRQPLASVTVSLPKEHSFKNGKYTQQYVKLLKEELNVKSISFMETDEATISAHFDTELTAELIMEGEVRDLIRTIQGERKTRGITVSQKISITVPEKFKFFSSEIKKSVQAETIDFGTELKIE